MIVLNCDQGSAEWHQARAGVITASMFVVARSRIGGLDEKQQAYVNAIRSGKSEGVARDIAGYRAPPKAESIQRAIEGLPVGDFSEAAKAYAFRLAIERISGEPLDESFETYSMRRGHELEPAARREHEIASGHMVQRAGFVLSEDHLFGASADGLIGRDGGSEYKCLISPERLQRIYIENDASEFMDQVQGCLWLTARKWWDFCLYCPALQIIDKQLWMRTFQRDDEYIDQMITELAEFENLVTYNETQLRLKEAA
jgi:hypothetical protein